MGADPTSGQYQAAAAQAQQAQAAGMGRGGAEALSGQVDRYYQGMENIIAMGQGHARQAMSGLGDVANIAQKRGRAVAQESMGDYTSALVPQAQQPVLVMATTQENHLARLKE